MAKHNYEKLHRDVDRWKSDEGDALDQWEEARWKEYDEDPEGRYFDTIGDSAGFRYQATESKEDELRGLIVLAEDAEKTGDLDEADRLVDELRHRLGQSDFTPENASKVVLDIDTDPEPKGPRITALNEHAKRDYEALRKAEEQWRDMEERDIDRWEETQLKEYDKDPEGRYFDTIGDSAGMRFAAVQAKGDKFLEQIQQAEIFEQQGNIEQADALVTELREQLGVTDEPSGGFDADLSKAKAKHGPSWRKIVLTWILLTVAGMAAAVFLVLFNVLK